MGPIKLSPLENMEKPDAAIVVDSRERKLPNVSSFSSVSGTSLNY